MKAMFIHDTTKEPFTRLILSRVKTIETRNKDTLSNLVGERVAIISTRSGHKPMVVGYCNVLDKYHSNGGMIWESLRKKTCIDKGSKYDATDKGKWLYFLTCVDSCDPYELPDNAIRHGRSWCEFDICA